MDGRGGVNFGCRPIFGRNMNIGFQFPILFGGESIEPCKIGGLSIDATPCTETVDVAHLPWLQAQAEKHCAVCRIGVEGETFYRPSFWLSIGIGASPEGALRFFLHDNRIPYLPCCRRVLCSEIEKQDSSDCDRHNDDKQHSAIVGGNRIRIISHGGKDERLEQPELMQENDNDAHGTDHPYQEKPKTVGAGGQRAPVGIFVVNNLLRCIPAHKKTREKRS